MVADPVWRDHGSWPSLKRQWQVTLSESKWQLTQSENQIAADPIWRDNGSWPSLNPNGSWPGLKRQWQLTQSEDHMASGLVWRPNDSWVWCNTLCLSLSAERGFVQPLYVMNGVETKWQLSLMQNCLLIIIRVCFGSFLSSPCVWCTAWRPSSNWVWCRTIC